MRLKSFHGPTLSEAMRLVREQLGENAIIVATRDDEHGGIRVTAAIEEVQPDVETAASSVAATVAAQANATGSEAIELIAETLLKHQVPNFLAERLLSTATQFANDDPVLALGAAFDTHLTFNSLEPDLLQKPLIFVGPPGVGKSLTLAKFATKATLAKSAVTVISADTDKPGGIEQLAAFTRILKADFLEIEDSHSLRDALALPKGKRAYLIDTPGRNPYLEQDRHDLQQLMRAANGVAVLTLPAGMDGAEAVEMGLEFRNMGATRLMFTRLDMTRRLGSLLRTAYELKMPLCHYSASASVTEPPAPLDPIVLSRLVLHGLTLPGLSAAEAAMPQTIATRTHAL